MRTRVLLVGVDGGQTSTKALVVEQTGRILGAGSGQAFDHFRVAGGAERNRTAILDAVGHALDDAGAELREVVAVGLGLTGVRTGGPETPLVEAIVRELTSDARIVVVADYETNLAGATSGAPGVVVIAGGGAISFGVTADGRQALASGYGYLLGDEGSAFDIGRRAINAATRARDGRGQPTVLEAIVRSTYGIDDIRDIPRVVYNADFSRDRISRLAPKVAEAAASGDAVARQIVERGGEELALAALAVIRQLFAPGEAVPVAITGGVFTAGEIVQRPFRETLARGWPEAVANEPRFPPAVGAAIFAARVAGVEPDADWFASVAASLPN